MGKFVTIDAQMVGQVVQPRIIPRPTNCDEDPREEET